MMFQKQIQTNKGIFKWPEIEIKMININIEYIIIKKKFSHVSHSFFILSTWL